MNINFYNNIGFYGINNTKPVSKIIKHTLPTVTNQHKVSDYFNVATNTAEKGCLNEAILSLVTEIKELFELAHSSIKSIAKSCNTRSTIKNGYPKLKKGIAGSRILEFANIGEHG